MTSVHQVLEILGGHRFNLNREGATQEEIGSVLRQNLGADLVAREHHLGPGDIPDFLIAGQIVVEVKLKNHNQPRRVFAQLERYAAYPDVKTIVLATNLSMGLPPTICGKPAFIVLLGAAWL